MKVYVDKLPKNCAECKFCGRLKPPAERPEIECMHCNMAKTFNSISPFCPLQSLADNDKQVRKEVAEQIKAVINDIDLEQDYADLLNLRNRIMEGEELYEEDHIILDHALDNLEILIKVIKILNDEKLKGEEK